MTSNSEYLAGKGQSPNKITNQADNYLRKHRINELFEDICSAICFEKPSNVQEFIKEQLKIKKQHGFKSGIFKKEEIQNIFTLFDLKKNGVIGKETCKQALKTLASSEFQWSEIDESNIPDKVDLKLFQALCDDYFFSFKPENHKRRGSGKKITLADVDRACVDQFKEFDQDMDSKLNSDNLVEFSKKLLSDGGYPDAAADIFEVSMDELGMSNNNQLKFKDFKTFVGYVLKKLQ